MDTNKLSSVCVCVGGGGGGGGYHLIKIKGLTIVILVKRMVRLKGR